MPGNKVAAEAPCKVAAERHQQRRHSRRHSQPAWSPCSAAHLRTLPPPRPAIDSLQATMKAIIRRAHRGVYEHELEAFIFGHPAQVALLGLQFQWTAEMQVGRGRSGGQGRHVLAAGCGCQFTSFLNAGCCWQACEQLL